MSVKDATCLGKPKTSTTITNVAAVKAVVRLLVKDIAQKPPLTLHMVSVL